jgi:hypothetical protein
MTFIAEGGGRTVTNCMVHGRRKVYEITSIVVQDVCYSEANEVHKTGQQVTNKIVYHIIAESEELARALYQKQWGSEFQRHTLLNVMPLFCIDAEIVASHN